MKGINIKVISGGSNFRRKKNTGEGKERQLSKDMCLAEHCRDFVPQTALISGTCVCVCVQGAGKERILCSLDNHLLLLSYWLLASWVGVCPKQSRFASQTSKQTIKG